MTWPRGTCHTWDSFHTDSTVTRATASVPDAQDLEQFSEQLSRDINNAWRHTYPSHSERGSGFID